MAGGMTRSMVHLATRFPRVSGRSRRGLAAAGRVTGGFNLPRRRTLSTRRSRWRRSLIAIAVVAAAGCASASGLDPGPLDVPNDHGYVDTLDPGTRHVDTGERISFNSMLPAGAVVTVTDIDAAFPDGPEIVFAGVADVEGDGITGGFQVLSDWPVPASEMEEFNYTGFRPVGPGSPQEIRTDGRAELVIVYQMPDEPSGRYVRDSITVSYDVDGTPYRVEFQAMAVLCTPAEATCPSPADTP